MKPKNNQANIKNKNKGSHGTNEQYDKNQGNRGKQLNPNQGFNVIIPFRFDAQCVRKNSDDTLSDIQENFYTRHIEKGFLEKFDAHLIEGEEKEHALALLNAKYYWLHLSYNEHFFIAYTIKSKHTITDCCEQIRDDFEHVDMEDMPQAYIINNQCIVNDYHPNNMPLEYFPPIDGYW